ncbi:MAG: glutamate-1-semialdehyde 2,1-aminomutase [Propionibacteriaceae bacterium]|jgi:glutamate-1-semialdehyde 2,1-aminomutase|nr:glutamate-1-semialdehyde 2,1-aminomutase [Propionibacteriaceae bacterium]
MSEVFEAARKVMPGGVSSPVRAFGSVGGSPVFVKSAKGAYVTGVDDREYLDLVGSWGPALLGHAHPEVVEAVRQAAGRGLSFGAPTTGETELAELIIGRVGGIEKARFTSTGTEATMTAIRLARGFTGRELIIKFAGCYHGHSDGLLAEAGSGVATAGLPGSAGVTKAAAGDTIVLPYNDLDAVKEVFASRGSEIAAIITEAAAANMGVVPPNPGFNQGLLRIAKEHGALLIQDEVLTGFRVSDAGYWGLEGRRDGWTPDIYCFGKVAGGGMPLAALAGRTEIMDKLAPLGPVYQAGTLSGNPLAVAAGKATLTLADAKVYARIDAMADKLAGILTGRLTEAGIPHRLQRVGSLMSVFWGEGPAQAPVINYAEAQKQDTSIFTRFFHSMLDQGVLLPPSAFEAWFLSAAHGESELDRLDVAIQKATQAISS